MKINRNNATGISRCRKFNCQVEEPVKLQKHKIIAQAFAKRKQFSQNGRISIECKHYTDPVGLNFELNSACSNELSTTWAENLPRLVTRRGAALFELSSNNHSNDSEVSYSVRHVSIESRRNSGDSQLSLQFAELKATRKVNRRRNHKHRCCHYSKHRKQKARYQSRDFTGRVSRSSLRIGSSTSLDSHFGNQILNVLSNNPSEYILIAYHSVYV